MSRAFVKEQEHAEPLRRPEPELPPGVKNHVTAAGEARLRAELERAKAERAAGPDEARRRQLDEDIGWLQRRLAGMVVTRPPADPARVAFGTTVTAVRASDGAERVVTLVGVDEVDADRGRISFLSPFARALVGAAEGDEVAVTTPKGQERWEILAIRAVEEG